MTDHNLTINGTLITWTERGEERVCRAKNAKVVERLAQRITRRLEAVAP